MDSTALKSLIAQNYSIRRMAKITGRSQGSIRYWLKKFGLITNIPRYNRGQRKEEVFACPVCNETESKRFYRPRGRCKNCHNCQAKERVREIKKRAVESKGGKCKNCGYCKNYAALDFHHTDPTEKDVYYSTSRHWSWGRLKDELQHCELLCRNCHAEHHNPQANMS